MQPHVQGKNPAARHSSGAARGRGARELRAGRPVADKKVARAQGDRDQAHLEVGSLRPAGNPCDQRGRRKAERQRAREGESKKTGVRR